MFKTETHIHTAESSACGKLSAEELVKRYHNAGYQTLFISDHFQKRTFAALGDVTWEEKVEHFLKGYRVAKKAGEKLGMHILLSAELQFNNTHNDYLLYGFNETFFKAIPNMLDMSIESFYPYAKKQGVTVIQAHPYRDNKCTPTPEFVDGFEVHNSNPRHENFTDRTIELATKYHKPMTAGSDTHRLEDVALSGVMTEKEICTVEDYLHAFYAGELTLIKGEETL